MSRSANCRQRLRSVRSALSLLLVSLPLFSSLFLTQRSVASTWEKYFTWDYNEEGTSIVQTSDSGFVVTGTTHSSGPGAPDLGNPFLMKLDSLGNMLWFQAYGSTLDEYARCVAITPDNGFILCGTRVSQDLSTSQFYVIKTDSVGDLEWERTYGPTDFLCDALSITAVRLGGYVITGSAASYRYHQPGEFLIIRTNMAGNPLWERKYSDPGYSNAAWSVQETPDGGFLVGGSSVGGEFRDRKMVLMRLNSEGLVKWRRHYDPNFIGECFSARLTRDGGCIMGGWTVPADSYTSDACLLKTDSDGNQQWKFFYGGARGEIIYSVQQGSDGGYVACGVTVSSGHGQQDLLLLGVSSAGSLLWSRTYGGAYGDYGNSIVKTSDGGYAMAGVEWSWGPGAGIYAIKTDANGNVHAEKNEPMAIHPSPLQLTVAPNPFVSFSTVPGNGRDVFSVYDVLGRRVGQYPGERIGSDLPAGVYLLRPNEGNAPAVRIVKTR